jgi:hypothetical protein
MNKTLFIKNKTPCSSNINVLLMSILGVSSNILHNMTLKSLLSNYLRIYITKKSPELRSGLLNWHEGQCLVFDDADRFGCFGYFQEVDAACNLIDVDSR